MHSVFLIPMTDCHLTCESQAGLRFPGLSRDQKWPDLDKEPHKPIETKEIYTVCRKIIIPQSKQTDIPVYLA